MSLQHEADLKNGAMYAACALISAVGQDPSITYFHPSCIAFQKRLHLVILQNHNKYGRVIRLGPSRLVFNTATALRELNSELRWNDIYLNDRITKSDAYLAAASQSIFNVFTALDNDMHRQKRKRVSQVTSERAMRSFEPTMAEQIDIYLEQILTSSKNSEPVNMTERSSRLSLDIVGQLAFGSDLEMQKKEANRFIVKGMQFRDYRGNIYMHYPILRKVSIDAIFDWVFYEVREKFFRLLESMIKARAKLGRHAKADFYSDVAGEMGTDTSIKSPRSGELSAEAWSFLTAVATRKCYRRLEGEIRSTFSSAADIKGGPKLASCTYLRACIDEALRMSPPSSITLWRVQDPKDKEPLVIDCHAIPRGITFGVNTYALHYNEAYFPEPFTFRPERWLDEPGNQEARKRAALEGFAAFSIGARSCAGKAMAYLGLSFVPAKTLWLFDFETAPGKLGKVGGGTPGATDGRDKPGEFQLYDIFTSQHHGPYLVFRAREDPAKV
ncbi:cytochrome P450 [Apodospora peruviana]|uniref:Cytochrome P450 n=1 Tax=Apodospora peruviana TaxID=516989 RepID=A0AAE0HX86_9PEZI|nr:cytochrome P450 [Apodospora peruviana]